MERWWATRGLRIPGVAWVRRLRTLICQKIWTRALETCRPKTLTHCPGPWIIALFSAGRMRLGQPAGFDDGAGRVFLEGENLLEFACSKHDPTSKTGGFMNALATTRLSSKGQVVIPEEIRIRLGLQPGTRFIVLAEGDMVLLKTLTVPSTESFRDLIRQAREAAALAGMTEEDIQETIQDLRKTQ